MKKGSDLTSITETKEESTEKQQDTTKPESRTSSPDLYSIVAASKVSKDLKAKSKSFLLQKRKHGDWGEFDLTHEWSPEDFVDDVTGDRFSGRERRPRTLTTEYLCAARPFATEPVRKFQEHRVQAIIQEVFESTLAEQTYDPTFCRHASVAMAEMIKERVKRLGYPRYKLVCHVAMGNVQRQGIRVASRCAWDSAVDGFAQYRFENFSLYATGVVFSVYSE